MGLHANGDRLWYAVSPDGMKFGPERELAANLGAEILQGIAKSSQGSD